MTFSSGAPLSEFEKTKTIKIIVSRFPMINIGLAWLTSDWISLDWLGFGCRRKLNLLPNASSGTPWGSSYGRLCIMAPARIAKTKQMVRSPAERPSMKRNHVNIQHTHAVNKHP